VASLKNLSRNDIVEVGGDALRWLLHHRGAGSGNVRWDAGQRQGLACFLMHLPLAAAAALLRVKSMQHPLACFLLHLPRSLLPLRSCRSSPCRTRPRV
jgi:hypothetical protein